MQKRLYETMPNQREFSRKMIKAIEEMHKQPIPQEDIQKQVLANFAAHNQVYRPLKND